VERSATSEAKQAAPELPAVAPAKPIVLGPAAAILTLQRTAGNRAVGAVIDGQRRLARRINVGQAPLKRGLLQKMTPRELALGDADVSFSDHDEYERWRNGDERIAYWSEAKLMARLDPGVTYVLGENHASSTGTASDLVKALGTRRYRHEGMTEAPTSGRATQVLGGLAQGRGRSVLHDEAATGGNAGEDFLPKVLRGLAMTAPTNPVDRSAKKYVRVLDEITLRLVSWALLNAPQEVGAHFWEHRAAFHKLGLEIADRQLGGEKDVRSSLAGNVEWSPVDDTAPSFLKFRTEFTRWATAEIERTRNQEAYRAFESDYAPIGRDQANGEGSTGDYDHPATPESLFLKGATGDLMAAEKQRDFSMLQHIRQAAAVGDLVYGLGRLHLTRLRKLLADVPNVRAMTIDEFKDECRAKEKRAAASGKPVAE